MNGKKRVTQSLKRSATDRVPIFMWYHPGTLARLAQLLELPTHLVGLAMGNDICMTWVNNNYAMEGVVHQHDGEGHLDEWGIGWEKKGAFNQICRSPIAELHADEIVRYTFPYGELDNLLARMNPLLAQSDDMFLGCDVSPCVFEMYNRLRGMQQAMLDLALHPKAAYKMMGRCADFAATLSQQAIGRFPLDMLWTGDDVASQRSMLMSPTAWRDLIKPHLAGVTSIAKQKGLWVAYHCCGSIPEIIEDLIEIGVDILNPIQYGCPGMEARSLKAQYGSRLAFMGGVDTQDQLPRATALEVANTTARLIDTMTAGGGGYILAASHTIPPETPMRNIFAMYEAAGLARSEIMDNAATLRAKSRG